MAESRTSPIRNVVASPPWILLLYVTVSCGSEPLVHSAQGGEGGAGRAGIGAVGHSVAGSEPSSSGGKHGEDGGAASASGHSGGSVRPEAGSAGDRSSAMDPDFDVPESEWEERLTFPSCRVRVARDPTRVWPRLAFVDDGPGTATAELRVGSTFLLGAVLGTAARNGGDRFLLSTSLRWTKKRRALLATLDVEPGVPLAVTSVEGNCVGQLAGQRSPQLFGNHDLSDTGYTQYGWLDLSEPVTMTWLDTVPFKLFMAFDVGDRWGGIVNFSSIQISDAPTRSVLHEAYRSNDLMRTPVGYEGTLFWTEGGVGYGKIMALQPSDASTIVVSLDYYPANVGVSNERLVWLGTEGDRVVDGMYEHAHLDGCERSETLDSCEPQRIAELPITSAGGPLAVHGEWAALTGCVDTGCNAYLVHLESSDVYRLQTPDDLASLQVVGLSSEALYALGFGTKTVRTADFEKFVRFDLSKLADNADRL